MDEATWKSDEGGGVAAAEGLEPGIHRDVPIRDYLALPYMSASRLEVFRRSPLQYRHALTVEKEPTDAMLRGTALHLALLEPGKFEGRYVTIGRCAGRKADGERCQYNGSVYRDGQSFCGTHDPAKGDPIDPSVHVMKQPEYDKVLGMRDAVKERDTPGAERARTLFEGRGEFEVTVVFDDPETGVRCRIRPDRLVERAGMHVALKSARNAAGYAFRRDAENRGYFRSLALYRRGLLAVGWPYRDTSVLAIEPEPPHDLECWLADEDEHGLRSADREVTAALREYAECERDDQWPGYNRGGFALLTRPSWATDTEET